MSVVVVPEVPAPKTPFATSPGDVDSSLESPPALKSERQDELVKLFKLPAGEVCSRTLLDIHTSSCLLLQKQLQAFGRKQISIQHSRILGGRLLFVQRRFL